MPHIIYPDTQCPGLISDVKEEEEVEEEEKKGGEICYHIRFFMRQYNVSVTHTHSQIVQANLRVCGHLTRRRPVTANVGSVTLYNLCTV